MTLFVKAFYGRANLGDDAIFARVLEWADTHGENLVVAAESERKQLSEFCRAYPGVKVDFVDDRFTSWIKAFRKVRGVVLGGGGLFPSDSPRQMLSKFLAVCIARVMGKQVFMLGLGVNPVHHPVSRFLWQLMAMSSRHISVRDRLSYDAVAACLSPAQRRKLSECADIVLSLDLRILDEQIRRVEQQAPLPAGATGRCVVAIASPWSPEEVRADPARMQSFMSTVEGLLALVIERGYVPVMVPFYLPSDLDIADQLAARFRQGQVLVERSDSPLVRLAWFSQADFALTMRFHSLVFAGCFAKPAYSIAYDHKLESLAEMMGLQRFVAKFGIRASEFFGEAFDLDREAASKGLVTLMDELPSVHQEVQERMGSIKHVSGANFDAMSALAAAGR